jgi:flavodoxin short chain
MLKDKVAVVTGAGRGIGREIAKTFAGYGAKVVVNFNGSEERANSLVEEVKAAGGEADVVPVSAVSVDELKAASSFALGCPAMGAEVLEESEMEPFVEEVEGFAAGKKIALFGSYGWGDGQWMRDWEERMNAAGATVVNGEGVIAHEAPDAEALEACRSLGKALI